MSEEIQQKKDYLRKVLTAVEAVVQFPDLGNKSYVQATHERIELDPWSVSLETPRRFVLPESGDETSRLTSDLRYAGVKLSVAESHLIIEPVSFAEALREYAVDSPKANAFIAQLGELREAYKGGGTAPSQPAR